MSNFLEIPVSWESVNGRIDKKVQDMKEESFGIFCDTSPKYHAMGYRLNPEGDNVIRVLTRPEVNLTNSASTDYIKEFAYSHNIVTNDGDLYYARQGANEAHAANEDFGDQAGGAAAFAMGTTAYTEAKTDTYNEFDVSGTGDIAGSVVNYTSAYPKTNDTGDSDNTGDAPDAVSYAINYSAASWNDTTVEQGVIIENLSPVGATKLLTAYSFTSFAKTASDTLKVFVNHTMNGV